MRILTLALIGAVALATPFSARAQAPAPLIHLADGDVAPGSASVTTPSGDRIGRLALAAHTRGSPVAVPTDPLLDDLARATLVAALDEAAQRGDRLGTRVLRAEPDSLIRIGVVAPVDLDGRTNLFPTNGPLLAQAVGSAGGIARVHGSAATAGPVVTVEVAAVAWRDSALEDLDDITATWGPLPVTQAELDTAAAQRWLDQENRGRLENNFPAELLAHRDPLLDWQAANILHRARNEPDLPPLATGDSIVGSFASNRDCSPNCEPFWRMPDRSVDVLRQIALEDRVATLQIPDFSMYVQRQGWLTRTSLEPAYWNSYRRFGVAARVLMDQEVVEHREVVRTAADALVIGAADRWDPGEYRVQMVVVAADPWPIP